MRNLMVRAWEIARGGQNEFGGKVNEYLSESLKVAWAEINNKEINVSWKNARGSEIRMTVEHVTSKVIGHNDFAGEITKQVDEMKITKLNIDGEEVNTWNTCRVDGKISTGRVKFKGSEAVINIDLPKEINEKVWGSFDARKLERERIISQVAADEQKIQKAIDLLACGA